MVEGVKGPDGKPNPGSLGKLDRPATIAGREVTIAPAGPNVEKITSVSAPTIPALGEKTARAEPLKPGVVQKAVDLNAEKLLQAVGLEVNQEEKNFLGMEKAIPLIFEQRNYYR